VADVRSTIFLVVGMNFLFLCGISNSVEHITMTGPFYVIIGKYSLEKKAAYIL
jgi:hypothetical protein